MFDFWNWYLRDITIVVALMGVVLSMITIMKGVVILLAWGAWSICVAILIVEIPAISDRIKDWRKPRFGVRVEQMEDERTAAWTDRRDICLYVPNWELTSQGYRNSAIVCGLIGLMSIEEFTAYAASHESIHIALDKIKAGQPYSEAHTWLSLLEVER